MAAAAKANGRSQDNSSRSDPSQVPDSVEPQSRTLGTGHVPRCDYPNRNNQFAKASLLLTLKKLAWWHLKQKEDKQTQSSVLLCMTWHIPRSLFCSVSLQISQLLLKAIAAYSSFGVCCNLLSFQLANKCLMRCLLQSKVLVQYVSYPAYLSDTELAQALVVPQNNHFIGHGCTDTKSVLNL